MTMLETSSLACKAIAEDVGMGLGDQLGAQQGNSRGTKWWIVGVEMGEEVEKGWELWGLS